MEPVTQVAKQLLEYLDLPYGSVSVWPWTGSEQNFLIVYYDDIVKPNLNNMPTEYKGYVVDYKERIIPVIGE